MFNYVKFEKAIRESGKSKKYFCDLVNRPYYYVRDIIRQKNNVPPEYQAIWAKDLGVSVEWLNDEEENPTVQMQGGGSEEKQKLYEIIENLSDEDAKRLLRIVCDIKGIGGT